MSDPRNISIHDFNYTLPDEKIALFPLEERDASRLLIYKDGNIQEDRYKNIANYLPAQSMLVFNNTRVINARLRFQKAGGAKIEIFCLEPAGPITEYSTVMNQRGFSKWKAFIGGAAKWKEPFLEKQLTINNRSVLLKAKLEEKIPDAYIVSFSWEPAEISFAEVLESTGDIPLPPYIKRTTNKEDENRYQTIYAQHNGSVAAPTAGLHFTEHIFSELSNKNISREYITLHVGAGTFKPVKADKMEDHEMHAEWIDVSLSSIKNLLNQEMIIAVGTTSLRTLESLYWLGIKVSLNPGIEIPALQQWDVYESPLSGTVMTCDEALSNLIKWMEHKKLERLFTQTQLLITPGYRFRVAKALITNFHQPQSTLLLLVAAAIGNNWKDIYQYALNNDFRFLSYGDGNLLFMAES
jgi:S-adenosylmethionine:tRNA ribosyltransferase-isomerase